MEDVMSFKSKKEKQNKLIASGGIYDNGIHKSRKSEVKQLTKTYHVENFILLYPDDKH
jgi:hypothetical protein